MSERRFACQEARCDGVDSFGFSSGSQWTVLLRLLLVSRERQQQYYVGDAGEVASVSLVPLRVSISVGVVLLSVLSVSVSL
mmetsp:Transcript_21605/g.45602  ORF Transcript_21605/g.45602 Transcript_21605/m.45602 type:complete len:81 (+) Transcript_21605:207-449(+)